MDGYCRGCLTKYADTSQLVQYSEKIHHLYTYSTGLQVKPNDPLFQLCKHCFIKMKLACKFKKQCRNADKKFCHFITANESGEVIDFDTFLQTYQETNSFPLKFPLNGSSTPSFLKAKEDDNESTCTSIRNFMTDILRAEDLPDTEAKIIQEMIEKEADVLNDSLDSAWLADDTSVVTDFRFSPFSTPSKNDLPEPTYTPLRTVETDDKVSTISSSSSANRDIDQETFIAAKKILLKTPSTIENQNIGVKKNIDSILTVENEFAITVKMNSVEDGTVKNIGPKAQESIRKKVLIQMKEKDESEIVATKDRIDQNLEEALKDATTNEFPLDSLIAISTPSVKSGLAGVATPLIADILFGNKSNDGNDQTKKLVYCTDDNTKELQNDNVKHIDDVESEVNLLEDFFNKETGEYIGDQNKEISENFNNFSAPKVANVGTKTVTTEEDFTCKICKKECTNMKSLRIHSKKQHKITIPKIEKKGKVLGLGQSRYDLSNFSCKICEKTYKDIRALKIHFTMMHNIRIETPQKTEERIDRACDRCGKVFHRKSNLYTHIRTVHKKTEVIYQCDRCSLVFCSASKLKVHSRTHVAAQGIQMKTNEKSIWMSQDSYISHHNQLIQVPTEDLEPTMMGGNCHTHHAWQSATCNICGNSFATKCNLTMHISRMHTKRYVTECDICFRKYFRKTDLDQHMRTHTGEKPFSCQYCPSKFRRRDTLNNHMKRHTNERPYQCEFCKNRFPSKSILNSHQKKSMTCLEIQTNENVPDRENVEYLVLENVNEPQNMLTLEELLGVPSNKNTDGEINDNVKIVTSEHNIELRDHDYSNLLCGIEENDSE